MDAAEASGSSRKARSLVSVPSKWVCRLPFTMQKPFQMNKKAIISIGLPLMAATSLSAIPGLCEPLPSNQAGHFHIIAADTQHQEVYHTGLEIKLDPGAHTYWRQPGDSGVPPVFSFEGSDNLALANISFPAPKRIREDGGEAFGYLDKVVFPVLITPKDKTRGVTLKVSADYAICQKICLPVKASLELTLPAAADDNAGSDIAKAEALVPRILSPNQIAADISVTREAGAKPTWLITWKGKEPSSDLFAEAPDGWFFETKTADAPNQYRLTAEDLPANQVSTEVTLTLTGPQQNFEFKLPLDLAAASPSAP